MVTEQSLRHGLITPELVSGIVLVSVFVAVADQNDGVLDVFAITVISVLVFWFTEVFAHTVAEQRRRAADEPVDLGRSLRLALHKSRGFLFAAVLPTAFLVLGLFGVNEGIVAYWAALWVGVASLAVIGWLAFSGRGMPWYWRIAGAAATACLGLMAVLLKILVH
jgi:hypothetical protein